MKQKLTQAIFILLSTLSVIAGAEHPIIQDYAQVEIEKFRSALSPEDEKKIVESAIVSFNRELDILKRQDLDFTKDWFEAEATAKAHSGFFGDKLRHDLAIARIAESRKKLDSVNRSISDLQRMWENGKYMEEYRKKLKDSLDFAKVASKVEEKLSQSMPGQDPGRYIPSLMFPARHVNDLMEVHRQFDYLKDKGLDIRQQLLELEVNYNFTIMGQFVRAKLERLLGSEAFCAAQTECAKPKRKRNKRIDLQELFLENPNSAPKATQRETH